MTLAQLDTTIQLVDKASQASDRWLFLAALAVIIVGGIFCIKWLVNSLEHKDAEHNKKSDSILAAHAIERKEWAIALIETKATFLKALEDQRKDFREELSNERHACAQERSLDREARHATAGALNNLALVTQDLKENNTK